jgi:hypothetical protein
MTGILRKKRLLAMPALREGMRKARPSLLTLCCLLTTAGAFAQSSDKQPTQPGTAVIWSDPGDISSRDLLYGSGGEKDQPHSPMVFEKEDMKGTNPKLDVRDRDGEKWKVKMGVEARPETVATRLLWAVGYFTEEDYFVPELQIDNLPAQLKRGQQFVKPGGIIPNVRVKRHPKHAEKDGEWHWRNNPFTGTRELNGLRVMMALINNWDLKDDNNAIYIDKEDNKQLYMVTDLGASFGTMGYRLGPGHGKNDLGAYKHSKFISHLHKDYVDFGTPAHATVVELLGGPFTLPDFISRQKLRWIGRHIPRADAKWIGGLLAQLKPEQIQEAFRAAAYSDKEIQEFSAIVEQRIAELQKL